MGAEKKKTCPEGTGLFRLSVVLGANGLAARGDGGTFIKVEKVRPGRHVGAIGRDTRAQLIEMFERLAVRRRRHPLLVEGRDFLRGLFRSKGFHVRLDFGIALRVLDDVQILGAVDSEEVEHAFIHRAVIFVLADVSVRCSLRFVGGSRKLHDAEQDFFYATRRGLGEIHHFHAFLEFVIPRPPTLLWSGKVAKGSFWRNKGFSRLSAAAISVKNARRHVPLPRSAACSISSKTPAGSRWAGGASSDHRKGRC